MAYNKKIEIYENAYDSSKNSAREAEQWYDTIRHSQTEFQTETSDTCKPDEQTAAVSAPCKWYVHSVLIGVLYAFVLILVFWIVYMEANRKDMKENSSVDDLKGEVNRTYQNIFSDLSQRLMFLEKQGKDFRLFLDKKQAVAFNVMNAVNFTGKNVIKFSRVILNEGNAYNRDTGFFTAPIYGIYLFNAHICCKKEKEIDYFIDVAGTKIVLGEFRVPDGAYDTKCTSFSAAALVQKDEKVSVGGMPYSELDQKTVYGNGNDLSSFSGTLVQTL